MREIYEQNKRRDGIGGRRPGETNFDEGSERMMMQGHVDLEWR